MSKKMTGNDFSKDLNALVAQAMNDGIAFQHVVCQLETTKAMLVGDMIASQRQTALMLQAEAATKHIVTSESGN